MHSCRLAANLKVIGHIRQEEDEKVIHKVSLICIIMCSYLKFTSKNTMVGRSDDESTVQELLEKYRKSRVSKDTTLSLLESNVLSIVHLVGLCGSSEEESPQRQYGG